MLLSCPERLLRQWDLQDAPPAQDLVSYMRQTPYM